MHHRNVVHDFSSNTSDENRTKANSSGDVIGRGERGGTKKKQTID